MFWSNYGSISCCFRDIQYSDQSKHYVNDYPQQPTRIQSCSKQLLLRHQWIHYHTRFPSCCCKIFRDVLPVQLSHQPVLLKYIWNKVNNSGCVAIIKLSLLLSLLFDCTLIIDTNSFCHSKWIYVYAYYYVPASLGGALSDDTVCRLSDIILSDVGVSVA